MNKSGENIIEGEVQSEEKKPTAQEFFQSYQELCKKTGFEIVVNPAWRFSNETSDWRMVLQVSVGATPKTGN